VFPPRPMQEEDGAAATGMAAVLDGAASASDWEQDCWSARPQPTRTMATALVMDITARMRTITVIRVTAMPPMGMVVVARLPVDGCPTATVTACGGGYGLATENKKQARQTTGLFQCGGDQASMKKVEEYLQHAAECRRMLQTALPEHRQQLEEMAKTWEQLAEARQRNLASKERDKMI
jgi:hypothetical protein